MTEILTPPLTCPTGASPDSPLAVLFSIAATSGRLTLEEERESAETTAADHVYTAYPDTLGQAVDHDAWTGYPALRDNAVQPSAVAHLDGGLWLHHTITADADYRDVLTLLVPCTCGHGYVASLLEDENDLLELLQELRPTGGHAVHSGDTGGPYCASTPTR
ncbi:hypothetical protein DBP19_35370 [Streptomyces sp. CS090A]|uniref:hypothetical protein n=1 Tax=Streptomyces sp. CS090A TaxID=2162710 RepID=UPI000D51E570|nr:hypothetical protein [Streptomyces sp. CS090A]PVC80774.1 hypothetical protein DBP19_35370 [Streptomyces sp. CS090A]